MFTPTVIVTLNPKAGTIFISWAVHIFLKVQTTRSPMRQKKIENNVAQMALQMETHFEIVPQLMEIYRDVRENGIQHFRGLWYHHRLALNDVCLFR